MTAKAYRCKHHRHLVKDHYAATTEVNILITHQVLTYAWLTLAGAFIVDIQTDTAFECIITQSVYY